MNRQQFFDTLAPQALRSRQDGSPLFPSVRLAQNLLETGCVIHPWNNLGGIKVGNGTPNEWWRGATVDKGTWEVYGGKTVQTTALFRAYDSVYDFYRDQDRLLCTDRYARVKAAQTPEMQAAMLQVCGYATDPAYPGKLVAIIRSEGLKKYDVVGGDETMQLSDYQWQTLTDGVESLLERKVINDKAWLDKAKNKTLTMSETVWLTFIVTVNR